MNLVGNAIKFTEKGEVEIAARFVNSNEPRLEFDITDSGIGLSASQQENLFKPFCQADSSTTRRFGGTGLGLNICRRLAEMLGGSVELIRSELGSGTTFRVAISTGPLEEIQLVNVSDLITHESTNPSLTHTKTQKLPEGCRILLAEDGPDNQRLISLILKKAGAEVVEIAVDGIQAVNAAMEAIKNNKPFDVILMDMQMPLMDGYEATRKLRSSGYQGPIIALTAHAMAEDREKCMQAGCNNFETKPINRANLLEAVNKMCLGPSTEYAQV